MPISDYVGPVFGFSGTGVGAFAVWHAARRKNQIDALRATVEREDTQRDNDRDDDDIRAKQWQAMLEHQRLAFEALLTPMREQIADLSTKVSALESAITGLRRLLRIALDHVSLLRARWPESHPIPDLPDALRDEL